MERSQLVVDLEKEVHVDRAQAACGYICLGLSLAQVGGLVCPNMQEGTGKHGCNFAEHLTDQLQRARLTGSEEVSEWSFGERCVLLILQYVVQVPEGLLLGDDGYMVVAGVVDQLAHIFAAQATAGQAWQRVRLVLQGVLKVEAVDVELVGSEGSYLQFLKVEGREWAAREIV